MELVVTDDVGRVLEIKLFAASVLIVMVDKKRVVAWMVDAVSVEFITSEFAVMVLPTRVIVLRMENVIVEAVILHAEILVVLILLPVMVDNKSTPPLIRAESTRLETTNPPA